MRSIRQLTDIIAAHGAAHRLLNDIGSRVRDGTRFSCGEVVIYLAEDDVPLAFIAMQDDADLTAVERLYGRARDWAVDASGAGH